MKKIVLLGASGSIGSQTIDVISNHKDEFDIIGLSVGYRINKLRSILDEFFIPYVSVAKEEDMQLLQKEYPSITFFCGEEGLKALASLKGYDMLVNAVVGFRGLIPTLTAIENGKDVALANKESLVVGGELIKQALKKFNVHLYPIDSEHSAIFQCLQGNQSSEIDKLILTASGGSFRDKKREELHQVTVKEALCHPNWQMGGRITIDSATMMNKGFEVIEAHYLFNIPFEKIEVIIHRESVIHSMVQYRDHALMAQLGTADMRIPIQYALSYPNRLTLYNAKEFQFYDYPSLHFEKADMERFPLLKLAYDVGRKGGNMGAVMNGADEQAIALFLEEKISFLDIEKYVIDAVKHVPYISSPTLEQLVESDAAARDYVNNAWKGASS
ncbi:MAG: 1-deoxy-D-xylulose-5-phosphate reductoisomerase [Erysipelotrichaceae bacterium]|nr:1-deoxy-D-xylulose-5-phosphate reductoisomerase [Erysipelotrichaceae bacterium]